MIYLDPCDGLPISLQAAQRLVTRLSPLHPTPGASLAPSARTAFLEELDQGDVVISLIHEPQSAIVATHLRATWMKSLGREIARSFRRASIKAEWVRRGDRFFPNWRTSRSIVAIYSSLEPRDIEALAAGVDHYLRRTKPTGILAAL